MRGWLLMFMLALATGLAASAGPVSAADDNRPRGGWVKVYQPDLDRYVWCWRKYSSTEETPEGVTIVRGPLHPRQAPSVVEADDGVTVVRGPGSHHY
jgi:hypothetical protein